MSKPKLLLSIVLLSIANVGHAQIAASRLHFKVTFSEKAVPTPVSGRLLVYMTQEKPSKGFIRPGEGAKARSVWMAARELYRVKAGDTVEIDPDEVAFPAPFSKAPAGDWYAMAMLDVDHNASYRPYTSGDLGAEPVLLQKLDPAHCGNVALSITDVVPARPITVPDGMELVRFTSPLLTAFWGRPIEMEAVVVLPPSYKNSKQRYPTVYTTHGWGANMDILVRAYGSSYLKAMVAKEAPEMIYVLMLGQFPSGIHEFADSVNNGPWSRALTAELVPYLESKYRMDAKPASRLLTGHSSGGWAGLWLQINYPKFFGGVWATSPDPVDFRSFTGPDITATPPENIYRKPDGSPWTLVREGGKDTMSLQDMVQQEKVLGEYGGQFQSFEAVFSPRGSDGRPMPLFDRETGEVDPIVAKAWEKYDIAKVVRARWKEIGPSLKGKVHIIVGTQDTYHLEQPVHLLEAAMKDLDSGAQFTYLEGKDHFDLYNNGLGNQIANEMYTAAHEKQ